MGVFQRMFSVSLHASGSPVADDTPSPFGPRNCGHCASNNRTTTIRYGINQLVAPAVTYDFTRRPQSTQSTLILCDLCDLCVSTYVTAGAIISSARLRN